MKKIKKDLETTQKMLLELPHWVFIKKVDPEVNTPNVQLPSSIQIEKFYILLSSQILMS